MVAVEEEGAFVFGWPEILPLLGWYARDVPDSKFGSFTILHNDHDHVAPAANTLYQGRIH